MRNATLKTIMWLEVYGVERTMGGPPSEVIRHIEEGDEAAEGARAEIVANATKNPAKAKAVAKGTGSAIAGAGAAIGAIPLGVTQIAGAVVAAVGLLIANILDWLPIGCDDMRCPDMPGMRESHSKSAIVGIAVGKGFPAALRWIKQDGVHKGKCQWFHRNCALHRYFHDGYVAERPSWDDPAALANGRVAGVNAKTRGWQYWWKHQVNSPLRARLGQREFDERQMRATWLLKWMARKMPCRELSCLQDVALAGNLDDERRRGSRWFASLYWTQRDLYEAARRIGFTKAALILKENNMKSAGQVLYNYGRGALGKGPLWGAWPWAAIADALSWEGLRTALRLLLAEQQRQMESTRRALQATGRGSMVAAQILATAGAAAPAEPTQRQLEAQAQRVFTRPVNWQTIGIAGAAAAGLWYFFSRRK